MNASGLDNPSLKGWIVQGAAGLGRRGPRLMDKGPRSRCHPAPRPASVALGGQMSASKFPVGTPASYQARAAMSSLTALAHVLASLVPSRHAAGRGECAPIRDDDGVGVPVEVEAGRDRSSTRDGC